MNSWLRRGLAGLRIARALLSSQYAVMLEYRAEIALWALSGVLPLVMLGVWVDSAGARAAGLGPQQLGPTSWRPSWCGSSRWCG